MGKGEKEKKTIVIEKIVGIVSWVIVVIQIVSIIKQWSFFPIETRFTGLLIAALGDLFFAMAVYTMRDSWRAGIPKEKTKFVQSGIYYFSRNPAFFGFFMLYIGVLIAFFNPVLLAITCVTIIMFHLQVLQEEKYLESVFGDEYRTYKKNVFRYLGRW